MFKKRVLISVGRHFSDETSEVEIIQHSERFITVFWTGPSYRACYGFMKWFHETILCIPEFSEEANRNIDSLDGFCAGWISKAQVDAQVDEDFFAFQIVRQRM